MRLYPLEGEMRSTLKAIKSQQDIEVDNLADEFIASQVLEELCSNVIEHDNVAQSAKNANRDKSLHQFASDSMTNHPDRHTYLQDSVDRIRNGDVLSEDQYASFKQQIKTLYRDTIREFSGVVATTAVGATPLLIRDELQPDLIIIDEAATMDEASLLILIAHYTPKAWVITGDIAQKPPHLTMEHDLGPGKVSSNPFAVQKQTSPLHRVVEGGAKHSTLSMNMRAHGNVAKLVNHLFYNDIMAMKHAWNEIDALDSIITWYKNNVNDSHPSDQCIGQLEFTHARATSRASSKVNLTHATWIIGHVLSIARSNLQGAGKNSGRPITVLVVSAYKQQVVELKQRFLRKAKEMELIAAASHRIKFKTVDNAQGDEADYVIYDMVTTSTPAFVAAEFRNTLGLSRATAFQVILANRGNFIGHEVNTVTQARALELSRIYDSVAKLGVNKRITSCKNCETPGHPSDQCKGNDLDMSSETCERLSCGKLGHTAAFCPSRFCGNCSTRGHTSGECPLEHFLCSACGRPGHHFFNCTTVGKALWCDNCKASGHTHFRCPQKFEQSGPREGGESSLRCRNCNETGHISSECTVPPEQRPCQLCGEVGHWKASCPRRRCKYCDEEGHSADVCPYDRCNRCFGIGHLAASCSNPPATCSQCGGPHLERNCRRGQKKQVKQKPVKESSSEPGFANWRRQVVENRGPSERLQAYNATLTAHAQLEAPDNTQNNDQDAWGAGEAQNSDFDAWGTDGAQNNNQGPWVEVDAKESDQDASGADDGGDW
jgi:hypothetical protein